MDVLKDYIKIKKITNRWNNVDIKRFIEAKNLYGNNWDLVSNYVETKDSIQCKAFFLNYKNCKWTKEEENQLLELIREHGLKWSLIAKKLNKSSISCKERYVSNYNNYFNLENFNKEEDAKIINFVNQYGEDWIFISKLLKNRDAIICKKRFEFLNNKKLKMKRRL